MRGYLNRLLVLGAGAVLLLLGAIAPVFDRVTTPLLAQGYSNTNPYAYWVDPGACNRTVSGSATGTNGLTTSGSSEMPVVQNQVSAGVFGDTVTFICNITPPNTIITSGNGIMITDAVFMYAPTTAGLGTQTSVLASGTMNGGQVFSYVAYPTPAIGESASTVTPVRADSGTMTITPVVASFNVTTLTAGSFYSVRLAPASGTLVFKTDLRQLLLRVVLATDGAANVINSSGVLVHFRGQ